MGAKLYFKFGAMGSSKSAQALITKFNYEERGMKVWLIKPAVDTRDGAALIRSRIGLEAEADRVIGPHDDIAALFRALPEKRDVIIADEAQFFTPEHIDQLADLVDEDPGQSPSVRTGAVHHRDQNGLHLRCESHGERTHRR